MVYGVSTTRGETGDPRSTPRVGLSIPQVHQEAAGMDNRHRDPEAFWPREEGEPCRSRATRCEGARTQRTLETGKLDPYPDIRS